MTDETESKVLLVVEDDEGLQRQLKWAYEGYQVVCAGDRAQAIEALRAHEPAVVTLDLGLPPDPDGTDEGFATLEEILRLKPDTKVIVASGHGARESALKAIAMGAYDFYKKPVDIDELGLIVARAFHVHEIEEENRRLESGSAGTVLGSIITAAPEMLKVARTIERVASADVSVMLLGASGTGKELLARAVHEKSGRKGEFVAINCAAIPENLLEAELFGYERGAFTGAVKSNVGKIELAAGRHPVPRRGRRHSAAAPGQAAALPPGARDRAHRRPPADRRRHAHRLRDPPGPRCDDRRRPLPRGPLLPARRDRGENPSLAERSGDAVLLARHFVNRFGRELNPACSRCRPTRSRQSMPTRWPGNVRELENRIKRAVIMADGKTVTAADLDLRLEDAEDEPLPINLRAAREVADRKAIRQAMSRTDNNISGAAKLLGVSRPTLYDLLKQYRLQA